MTAKERYNMSEYEWNDQQDLNGRNDPPAEEAQTRETAAGQYEAAASRNEIPNEAEQSQAPEQNAGSQPAASQSEYHYRMDREPGDAREPWNEPLRTARPAQSSRENPSQPVREKKRSGGFWKKAVALSLVCALLGGGAGVGGSLLVNKLQGSSGSANKSSTTVQVASPRETADLNVVTVDSGKLMNAAQVYKANVNSTVGITTEITTTNWWGYQSTAAAAGSGFILTEDGYVLTNQHVIDKANTITVAMYDGTSYPATLVGYDKNNDIAVLKIDAKGLIPVTLGDSDALQVGDEVIAIGNPLGELTFSLTKGNVSALNRPVTLSSSVTMELIQTDAAINSGNSGGALFNMYGEVVGITNAKYSSSGYSSEASIDNIGFAIPINSIREIVSSIIEKGYISTPYIGVGVANVSEESQSYGMPKGAAIRSVDADGPAAQAGLQANDIVTAVNGKEISGYNELAEAISNSEVGGKLELTVYRQGQTLTITVTVGEKTQSALPDESQSQQQNQQEQQGQQGQQGGSPWGGFPWGWGFGG